MCDHNRPFVRNTIKHSSAGLHPVGRNLKEYDRIGTKAVLGTCGMHEELWCKNFLESYHLEDWYGTEMIPLKWVLEKEVQGET
jgi:hypothetical protein